LIRYLVPYLVPFWDYLVPFWDYLVPFWDYLVPFWDYLVPFWDYLVPFWDYLVPFGMLLNAFGTKIPATTNAVLYVIFCLSVGYVRSDGAHFTHGCVLFAPLGLYSWF
jgi:hypothetical protein